MAKPIHSAACDAIILYPRGDRRVCHYTDCKCWCHAEHSERCCMEGAWPGWGPHPDCPGVAAIERELAEARTTSPALPGERWEHCPHCHGRGVCFYCHGHVLEDDAPFPERGDSDD